MSTNASVPTHLFVGPETIVTSHVEELLKKAICPEFSKTGAGCFCNHCRKLSERQHPSLVWIEPEGNYSVSDVDIVFERSRFALEDGEQFFFVLSSTHLLNQATANKLLKVLEEPPSGYNFFLLTDNEQSILPTIRSRCMIHHFESQESQTYLPQLLTYFLEPAKLEDPQGFESVLRKEHLSDSQSLELASTLLNYAIEQIKIHAEQDDQNNFTYFSSIVSHLQGALRYPPSPGSSVIFWKNLYINFPRKKPIG